MTIRFFKTLPLVAVLLATTAFIPAARADDSYGGSTASSNSSYNWLPSSQGLYVGAQAGGSFATGDLDNSGDYAISLGWRFHPMIRAELEAAYSSNGLSDSVGHEKTYTYMANLFYDFKNTTPFTPYVGGGVGWAENFLRNAGYKDDDSAFVYQLGAGVAYDINPHWAVTADYRWVDTSDFDHGGTVGSDDYSAHVVRGGVRYTF